MDILFWLVFSHWIYFALSVGEITEGPTTQVLLLGEYADFHCRTADSSPRWVINGTILSYNLMAEYRNEKGINVTLLIQMGSRHYASVLQVHAVEANNNTVVQCAVFSGDALSEPALLKIQGLLAPPPDLSVKVLTFSTVRLTWSPPHTLDITGNTQPSILGYSILIRNGSGDIVMAVNSTTEEYHYTGEECQLASYEVCVSGINGVGIGLQSQPIAFDLGFVVLSGPNSTIRNTPSQFSCEVPCHESLLVAWVVNGSFLSHSRSSQLNTMRNDSSLLCPLNENSGYTDILEVSTEYLSPFTVRCAAIHMCNPDMGIAGCLSEVCYSKTIVVEVIAPLDVGIFGKEDKHIKIWTTAGIAVFICVLLGLILGSAVICCIFIKKKTAISSYANNEVIYDQCGDPIPVMGMEVTTHKSLSPQLEDCVAYDSSYKHPLQGQSGSSPDIMDSCVAYVTSP